MFDKVTAVNPTAIHKQAKLDSNQPVTDFKEVLTKALNKVSESEKQANLEQALFLEGNTTDLHQLMVASQKATITIEAAVQIQQKVIDTYNEVMRMQI